MSIDVKIKSCQLNKAGDILKIYNVIEDALKSMKYNTITLMGYVGKNHFDTLTGFKLSLRNYDLFVDYLCTIEARSINNSRIIASMGRGGRIDGRDICLTCAGDDEKSLLEFIEKVETQLNNTIIEETEISNVKSYLFPIEIFSGTRGYLEKVANQVLLCYENGIYDGCAILIRKLIEIMIIDCFIEHKTLDSISNQDGKLFDLKDMIDKYLNSKCWHSTKEMKNSLYAIRDTGNRSTHSLKYVARKSDIDKIKDLRVSLEELIHTAYKK